MGTKYIQSHSAEAIIIIFDWSCAWPRGLSRQVENNLDAPIVLTLSKCRQISETDGKFSCMECGLKYGSSAALYTHRKKKHSS